MLSITDPLRLQAEGYEFLSNRRMKGYDPEITPLGTLFRERVAVLAGPELAAAFYNDDLFTREDAIPAFVQDTLFGRSGIQTLVGPSHLSRKRMFLQVLQDRDSSDLVRRVAANWDAACANWAGHSQSSLHESAARILFISVCEWLGVPLPPQEISTKTNWMIAMVDGFLPLGARHLRARLARRHAEHWIGELVTQWRLGLVPVGQRFDGLAAQGGERLDEHTLVVELLNLIRPVTAVSWYVTFAAHALQQWPEHRPRVVDPQFRLAFINEVRRYYPFVPFIGARAARNNEDADYVYPRELWRCSMSTANTTLHCGGTSLRPLSLSGSSRESTNRSCLSLRGVVTSQMGIGVLERTSRSPS